MNANIEQLSQGRFTPTTSEKYQYINTATIVSRLYDLGFEVRKFEKVRVKNPERDGYQSHVVVMGYADPERGRINNEGELQLYIANANDGTKALTVALGFFRFICSNGLVTGDTVEAFRIPHRGKEIDTKLAQFTQWVENNVPKMVNFFSKMKTITLNEEQKKEYIKNALTLKYGTNADKIVNITTEARRNADQGESLYLIYNRMQECLIMGTDAQKIVIDGNNAQQIKRINLRQVKSPLKKLSLNQKLFNLTVDTMNHFANIAEEVTA
jgi:hypothetical protein